MTIRKLKRQHFKTIKDKITDNAEYNPNDNCYNAPITINEIGYILKIQFVDENKILIWEALEIVQKDHENGAYTVITDSAILSAILNLLIWQKVANFKMYL